MKFTKRSAGQWQGYWLKLTVKIQNIIDQRKIRPKTLRNYVFFLFEKVDSDN